MSVKYAPDNLPSKDDPLPWQELGFQETASGYGLTLTTRRKVFYEGRWRRVRATCISNVASLWIVYNKQKLYLRG